MPESAVVRRLRADVLGRRLRVKDFFNDLDPLRRGKVTASQFRRCVSQNIPTPLSDADFDELNSLYLDAAGEVAYPKFVADMDVVFTETQLERSPTKTLSNVGDLVTATGTLTLDTHDEDVAAVVGVIARFCSTRGFDLRSQFADFDKLRRGTITAMQFRRQLPPGLVLSEQELLLLINKLRRDGGVDYMALCEAVERQGASAVSNEPFERTMTATNGLNAAVPATATPTDAVGKLRVGYHATRVRPLDFFRDYDKLNRGTITENQFIRSLASSTTAPGSVKLSPVEVETVVSRYKDGEGRVNYRRFCKDVGGAFVVPVGNSDEGADVDLQRDPLAQPPEVVRTDVVQALPRLSDEREDAVAAVLENVREQIVTRRIDVYPVFKDMDKRFGFKAGVTDAQLSRALRTATVNIDEAAVALLAEKFRNPRGFVNYLALLAAIDPHTMLEQTNQLYFDTATLGRGGKKPVWDPTADATHGSVDDTMAQVRLQCVQRRLRPTAFFADNDTLRCGFITENQFRRGLNQLAPTLSHDSVAAVVAAYSTGTAARPVAWKEFCTDVDRVFTLPGLELNPGATVAPLASAADELLTQTSSLARMDVAAPALAAKAQEIVDGIKASRFFDFRDVMRDFDKHNIGHITRTQFAQGLSFGGVKVSSAEVKALQDYYEDTIGVNYRAFLAAITPTVVDRNVELRSTLHTVVPASRTNGGGAASDVAVDTVLRKVQTHVAQSGRRVIDYIKDYDRLHTGRTSVSTFTRGLDLAALGLTSDEIAALASHYRATTNTSDDDSVNYVAFAHDVEAAMAPPALERDPLASTHTAAPLSAIETAALARKSDGAAETVVCEALAAAGNTLRQRRLQLLPAFQDYDRVNNGSVSKNDFARVVTLLRLPLTAAQLKGVIARYAVRIGGREDVHYRAFAQDVERTSRDLHTAFVSPQVVA